MRRKGKALYQGKGTGKSNLTIYEVNMIRSTETVSGIGDIREKA